MPLVLTLILAIAMGDVQNLNPTDSAEAIALKMRHAQLLRKKLELVKNFGLSFYQPHVKQDAFHQAGIKFKRRMMRSGNRFGKSHMGCAEDCAWMLHERPWYPEGHPARRGGLPQHPIKLLTITTDWDKVDEIFTSQRGNSGKIWKFIPPGALKESHAVRRNHSGCIDTIEFRDGSLWRFDTVKSFMSNPQGSESSDWDAIHVDEPCPEAMWKASARGLIDRGGSAWFTLTPLKEFWINDYFFPQDTGGKARDNVWASTGSMHENPYLSKEAIAEFESTLSDDEKQCRLHGIPLHLVGLVYKEFSWDQNVLSSPPPGWDGWLPPSNFGCYLQIDPHPRTPHCALFATVLPTGERIYFDDVFWHGPMDGLAEQIKAKLDGRVLIQSEMDPLGFIEHPCSETTMADDLAVCGIYVEKATKALDRGILKVKKGLKDRSILFTPNCRRALWEIQRYCWDEEKNRPVDEDDHAMECLYRMEVMEPRHVMLGGSRREISDEAIAYPELSLKELDFA